VLENLIHSKLTLVLVSKLDHIGIYVKDLAKSVSFYKDVFGWNVVKEFGSGELKIVLFDVGGGLLELVQRAGSPAPAPTGNWSHLALHVKDWAGIVAKVEARGGEVRKITMPDGSHNAFFKDPDGHTIEAMEKGFSA
jgi:lactoylglutathione lyase